MVFSSPLFLFLFLPVVLTVYVLLPGTKARNCWLLLMSLAFYAWGEISFVFLLLASTLMNYGLGLWVERRHTATSRKLDAGLVKREKPVVVVNEMVERHFNLRNPSELMTNETLK